MAELRSSLEEREQRGNKAKTRKEKVNNLDGVELMVLETKPSILRALWRS